MSLLRPILWYHSRADLILSVGPFKQFSAHHLQSCSETRKRRKIITIIERNWKMYNNFYSQGNLPKHCLTGFSSVNFEKRSLISVSPSYWTLAAEVLILFLTIGEKSWNRLNNINEDYGFPNLGHQFEDFDFSLWQSYKCVERKSKFCKWSGDIP